MTQQRSGGTALADRPSQKATNVSEFPRPAHAVVDGKPVRLTHLGDVEGNSPSFLCVDERGQSSWRPVQEVTIIDPEYLPMGAESLSAIRTAIGGRL